MALLSSSLEIFAALVTIALLVGTMFEKGNTQPMRKYLIILLCANTIMLLSDAVVWQLDVMPKYLPIVRVLAVLSYSASCTMCVTFAHCVMEYAADKGAKSKKILNFITIMWGIGTLIWIFCVYRTNYIGHYDENWINPVYIMSQCAWGIILALTGSLIWKNRKKLGKVNTIAFTSYVMIPLIGLPIQRVWEATPLYLAVTLVVIVIYVIFHIEQGENMVRQQEQLAQSRVAIMLSQIQPHFLYNTLAVIQDMCHGKAPEAEQAAIEFSEFLRSNLDSLNESGTISFSQELRHTQNYLSLESKRFRDRLKVEYNIETRAFRLPPLTLQPIVENAVRYGVMQREEGGTVWISTRDTQDSYIITVVDDGVGFDMSVPKNDGRSHIGISNVENRLKAMCNGTISIESILQRGTTVVITLPKGDEI